MLIDEVEVNFKAGHGGAGRVSMGGYGADGGNGGDGGDIYINVTSDLKGLNQFSVNKKIKAEDGEPGGKNQKQGKGGYDLDIYMPVGCELTNLETGKVIELTEVGQRLLLCKGGIGGRGNWEFRSRGKEGQEYAQPGRPGEEKAFAIVLKYLADFGLVGLPNAGKSSLLNVLTNAKAEVANYPFTTLEANLGVIGQKVIADIPGLIEGASKGKGLGTKFLKHIEKVRLVMHCIAADSADVAADYKTIHHELQSFAVDLTLKPEVIFLTKTDLVSPEEVAAQVEVLKQFEKEIYEVSIYEPESIAKIRPLFS